MDKEKYPVLAVLSEAGISGPYDYAADQFKYMAKKKKYANKCDLCTEIRSWLIQKSGAGMPWRDLCPAEFYADFAVP